MADRKSMGTDEGDNSPAQRTRQRDKYMSAYYQAHKEELQEAGYWRRHERRIWAEASRGSRCESCGISEGLKFRARHPGMKTLPPSRLWGLGDSARAAELTKYLLLCKTCADKAKSQARAEQGPRTKKEVRMTDKEDLEALLTRFGVGYEVKGAEYHSQAGTPIDTVELRAQRHDKVEGYNMFMTDFLFDKDGSFLSIGIWE